ncbi:MAG: ABC transporter ATP-binding protein [Conexivisphaerales archaeon]
MAVIEFKDVSHVMPNGIMALSNVNLKIERGEVLAIVGSNGAGKTTLLKHMNGLLKPSSGSVFVFGSETKGKSVAELSRHVGLVFQNSDHQIFSESVFEEIAFGLRNFGFAGEELYNKIISTLRWFDLYDLKDRPPMTLSGGEKKRLCIATVIAWNPEVLVLDEPTVGQDYPNKVRLFALIKRLIGEGRTVVIVSHDLEFLWPLSPRTVVMANGRILTEGSAESIFMDEELLNSAGLRQPQLAQLAMRLNLRSPFSSLDDAVTWFRGRI